jgi:adenylate cyclase
MRDRTPGPRLRLGFLVVGVVAAALGIASYATDLFRPLEQGSLDARFSIRGTQERPGDLVVVQIDDVTFDELGEQWPFPRSFHARLIDHLRRAGARAIAFDVQFTEPTTPREDNALISAVGKAGGVVLATTEVNARGQSNVFGGEAVLRSVDARAGSTVIDPDEDGVLRKLAYEDSGLKSFAIATVESSTGEEVPSDDLGDDGKAWIDYRGPPGTIETVSFSQAMRGHVPAGVFRGKTVVVGASAPTLQDVHSTSVGGGLMSGPEVQANAIWTVEHDFPLDSIPWPLSVALIAIIAFVAPVGSLRLQPLFALAAAVVVAGVYLVGVQLAFNGGHVMPVVDPLVALTVGAIGTLALYYLLAAFERQRVRDTFARFVPEAVVDQVLELADADLRLGGVRREGTVLFSDLRNFTTFSETLEPDQVVDLLNRYLSEMSDAIMDHGGTLTAYMGDGIMAVFGAPIEQDDHAQRALAAAREMLEVRLPRFNEWMRSQGLGDGFQMGIGLNSGVLMSGQVGSERRLEYTAIGDVTNTASRLEGMTKGTPHQLFMAEQTKEKLDDEPDGLAFVDEFDVRGRAARMRVWTVTGAS